MKPGIAINEHNFELLYRLYKNKLLRIAYCELQDEEDAANLVHDVFTSLWERRKRLYIENPEHYLVRAVKLRILNYFRNKYRRTTRNDQDLTFNEIDYSTENTLALNSTLAEIEQLIKRLPERCQLVYQMHHSLGMDCDQIACDLCISTRSVRNYLVKANSHLRLNLKREQTA